VGPVSLLNWPVAGTSAARRRTPRAFSHVRLEVTLLPSMERESSIPLLHQLQSVLHEAEIIEEGDLLTLAAATLHACARIGFRRVDHWEVRPGGWLPLRAVPHGPQIEPVSEFIGALQQDQWKSVAGARELAVRLSGPGGVRLAFVLRRVHRERHPTLTLELSADAFPASEVRRLEAALRARLPVLRSAVVGYEPAVRRS
jgi:hypothetical protein